jgi:hypothetical protein
MASVYDLSTWRHPVFGERPSWTPGSCWIKSERPRHMPCTTMGDPVGAASHVKEALQPDGTFMIVEPSLGIRSLRISIRSAECITGSRRWYALLVRSVRKLALPLERKPGSGASRRILCKLTATGIPLPSRPPMPLRPKYSQARFPTA